MILLRQGMRGSQVEMLQLALERAGFSTGTTDGVFGQATLSALRRFQISRGLIADGIVGSATWSALRPYLVGYVLRRIKPGDTLYRISKSNGVPVEAILAANPNLNPVNMQINRQITIPFPFDVVPETISYTYELMVLNIEGITMRYPFVRSGILGRSTSGTRNIYNLSIGTGSNQVLYNASHHANEWITSVLLMKFIEQYAKAYAFGYNLAIGTPVVTRASDLYERSTIHFVPMVNPEGVDLVTGNIAPGSQLYETASEIGRNYPQIPFPSGWKANIFGVDINLNYPAGWEIARRIKFEQGFTTPAPRDFVGTAPLSEQESRLMTAFTNQNDISLTLSYHTQGRVIYWKFLDYQPPDSLEIGRQFSSLSGYMLEETPIESGYAGYKDWFIQTFNRPGYTIEVGLGVSPVDISQFPQIYDENRGILVLAAQVT